jgi:hypothetical protein
MFGINVWIWIKNTWLLTIKNNNQLKIFKKKKKKKEKQVSKNQLAKAT